MYDAQVAGVLEAAVRKAAEGKAGLLQVEGGPALDGGQLKATAAALRQLLALKEAGNK